MKIDHDNMRAVYENVLALLSSYEPTSVKYLSSQGNWLPAPESMRDRISNELWHRFWQLQHANALGPEFKILWQCLSLGGSAIYELLGSSSCHEQEDELSKTLVVMETVGRLVAYEALNINSKEYITEWDYEGKKRQLEYIFKVNEFFKGYVHATDKEAFEKVFADVLGELRTKSRIFDQISRLIAEEDKVRRSLKDILEQMKNAQEWNMKYSLISERIQSSIASLSKIPGALLRPCLDIFEDQSIEIASGFHYDVSGILGSLTDIRATDTLIRALMSTEIKYTNIRCNLIYALGNLKQASSLHVLTDVLAQPDTTTIYLSNGTQSYEQSLRWEKQEALWALGKLREKALPGIPVLTKHLAGFKLENEIAMAWAMGMIGSAQKEKYGGVDAGIVTALMNLLMSGNVKVLEEIAFSLRRLGLPDFLHTLYFHNTATLPLTALKASGSGLYELSETIFHLISVQRPVVVAVTGDSGTGKTFFCECIRNGFGSIKKEEILYLMRDNPGHMYIFNRMMGIKLLKELFDPEQYHDYPYNEEEDDPRAFFNDFMKKNSNKKLIILDGWMDETYFYQVLKIFYLYNHLDIVVNFRTTFSTKRLNLEQRERALESIKTCLTFIEKPVIEDTEFYRNGDVLIYNLDNSIPSRLTSEQIREVFARQKVETWGDYIRIGRFKQDCKEVRSTEQKLGCEQHQLRAALDHILPARAALFSPDETRFNRILNQDTASQPHLLNIIILDNCALKHIDFYTQGQLAFGGYNGMIGIMSGFTDHVLFTRAHEAEVLDICVVGGDICSIDIQGNIKLTSFDRKTLQILASHVPLISALGTDRSHLIITGHTDGTIMVWDTRSKEIKKIVNRETSIVCVSVDHEGTVYAGTDAGEIICWDLNENNATIIRGTRRSINDIARYPGSRIIAGIDDLKPGGHGSFCILDIKNAKEQVFITDEPVSVNSLCCCHDGRVIAGMNINGDAERRGILRVYDLQSDHLGYTELGPHGFEIRDCFVIGPRIITCGTEKERGPTLRIWGTANYVKSEVDKLRLISETMVKPSYYRTLF
jgi:WD40 repeat protein